MSTNFEDLVLRDITANRPAAGKPGRLFFDSTLNKMQRDNGATWDDVESAVTSYTDELAQDAIGAMIATTDTVTLTYTDGTPELKADVKKQMSITSDASGIKLSADSATPGNNKVYGTDGSGTKGWKADPAGSGDFVGPGSSTDNAVVRFDSTTGKLGQNSLMTVDDSGSANIPTGQTYKINGSAHTHTSEVDDTAYDATTWNGDTTHAPSKNAVRDKIESLSSGGVEPWLVDILPTISDPDASTGTWVLLGMVNSDNITYPLVVAANPNSVGPVFLYNSSAAQNDAISWKLALSAGTWNITIHCRKSSNTGIFTVNLDGASMGTVDSYAAAAAYGKLTVTGWSVPTSGAHVVQLKMATKNGSSSGYLGEIMAISLRRTA